MAEFIGGPIDEGVVNQLKVRSDVLSRTEGNEKFLKSRLFNSAWINVVSSANLIDDDDDSKKGAELAKRYVLSGGSLTWNGTNFNIGGGIDFRETDSNKVYNYSEAKGVRPRPGITGFQIVSKNRFGAIREATINFNVWSQEDLVNIERLYFRPGFHAVVEWGHSEFVNNGSGLETGRTGVASEFFNDLDTPSKIAGILKEATDERSYNYDSFIGVIKNFSYSFRQDGGYDCVISIISKGEILDSIRLGGGDPTYEDKSDDSGIANVNVITYLVKILNQDRGTWSNGEESFITKRQLKLNLRLKEAVAVSGELAKENFEDTSLEEAQILIRQAYNNSEVKDIRFKNDILSTFLDEQYPGSDDTPIAIDKEINVKSIEILGGTPDYNIVYVPLNLVLELINLQISLSMSTRKVPKFTNRNVISRFETVSEQIILDPEICLLPPKSIKKLKTKIKLSNNSFKEVLFYPLITLEESEINDLVSYTSEPDDISNIFISSKLLFKLCRRYLGKDTPAEESLAKDFIQDMMDEVGRALGEINEFDIEYTPDSTRNEAYIVDRKVTPAPGTGAFKGTQISQLPLTGLRSFLSNLSIQTKISNQLGSQIAIAAQGSSTDSDYNAYVANYKEWNRNLYDRFDKPVKAVTPRPASAGRRDANPGFTREEDSREQRDLRDASAEQANKLQEQEVELAKKRLEHLNELGRLYNDYHDGNYNPEKWHAVAVHGRTLYKKQEEVEDLVAGRPPKGLIPTELSFTMDGIGGLKIGQSFKVQEGILPFTYNRYGYIITGLEHSIQTGKWLTTVRAQTFILQFK